MAEENSVPKIRFVSNDRTDAPPEMTPNLQAGFSGAPNVPMIQNIFPNIAETFGVITGCDKNHEWMIQWWILNYCANNRDIPFAFCDFGMSENAKQFIIANGGTVFSLPKDVVGKFKTSWFYKPFAMVHGPFDKFLWVDLDCEIRGRLMPIFEHINKDTLLVTMDPYTPFVKDNPRPVATGVVGSHKQCGLMKEWCTFCFEKADFGWRGDQECLNTCLMFGVWQNNVRIMAKEWQWLMFDGPNPNAIIFHWHGIKGKQIIYEMLKEAHTAQTRVIEKMKKQKDGKAPVSVTDQLESEKRKKEIKKAARAAKKKK